MKQRHTSPAVFALSKSLAAQREEREDDRELFKMVVSSGIILKYSSSQLLSPQPEEGPLVLLADVRNSLSNRVGLSVCLGTEARVVECSFILEVSGLRTRGFERGRETLVFTKFCTVGFQKE